MISNCVKIITTQIKTDIFRPYLKTQHKQSGYGIIINVEQRIILTTADLVDNSANIDVYLHNSDYPERCKLTVLSREFGLALLQLKDKIKDISDIQLSDSFNLKIGDKLKVFGHCQISQDSLIKQGDNIVNKFCENEHRKLFCYQTQFHHTPGSMVVKDEHMVGFVIDKNNFIPSRSLLVVLEELFRSHYLFTKNKDYLDSTPRKPSFDIKWAATDSELLKKYRSNSGWLITHVGEKTCLKAKDIQLAKSDLLTEIKLKLPYISPKAFDIIRMYNSIEHKMSAEPDNAVSYLADLSDTTYLVIFQKYGNIKLKNYRVAEKKGKATSVRSSTNKLVDQQLVVERSLTMAEFFDMIPIESRFNLRFRKIDEDKTFAITTYNVVFDPEDDWRYRIKSVWLQPLEYYLFGGLILTELLIEHNVKTKKSGKQPILISQILPGCRFSERPFVKVNDIIDSINGEKVESFAEMKEIVKEMEKEESFSIETTGGALLITDRSELEYYNEKIKENYHLEIPVIN